jgi:hypothetical protein
VSEVRQLREACLGVRAPVERVPLLLRELVCVMIAACGFEARFEGLGLLQHRGELIALCVDVGDGFGEDGGIVESCLRRHHSVGLGELKSRHELRRISHLPRGKGGARAGEIGSEFDEIGSDEMRWDRIGWDRMR